VKPLPGRYTTKHRSEIIWDLLVSMASAGETPEKPKSKKRRTRKRK